MRPVRSVFGRSVERPTAHLLLGGILLVGIVLRGYALGAESLWVDEMHTVRALLDRSLANIVLILPVQDPHPPLYYALLWGWTRVTGVSATAVRSFSVVASALSIPLVYVVADRLYDRRVGLVAALLFALSPFYVWYARDARMYALLTLLGLVSVHTMLTWLDGAEAWWRERWGYWLASVALVYTHAFGILLVFAQNAYVLGFMGPDDADDEWFAGWTRIQGLIGLAAIPLVYNLAGGVIGGGRFEGHVGWIPAVTPATLWKILGSYVGRAIPPSSPMSRRSLWVFDGVGDLSVVGEAVTLVALGLLLFPLVRYLRADAAGGAESAGGETVADSDANESDSESAESSESESTSAETSESESTSAETSKSESPSAGTDLGGSTGGSSPVASGPFLACWLLVPVAAMYVASLLVTPLLFDRFTAAAGVAAMILLARAITDIAGTDRQTLVAVGLVVVVLGVSLTGIYGQPQKQQWDEAASIVEANAEAGDAVLVTPFWANDSYQYYAERTDLAYGAIPSGAESSQVADATNSERVVWLIVSNQNATQRERVLSSLDQLGSERDRHEPLTDVDVYRFVRN